MVRSPKKEEEVEECKEEDKEIDVKTEKTASALKVELDNLGVEYKGNASRATLEELLYKENNKANNVTTNDIPRNSEGDEEC